MKFMTSSIAVGSTTKPFINSPPSIKAGVGIVTQKQKSFDDIVQEYMDKKNGTVKTAAVAEEQVKVSEADEGPSSGQLKVEPLHQTGESTNQDSVAGGKDKDTSSGAKRDTDTDADGPSSGQPEAEGKLTNDPKVETEANEEVEVKLAEETKEAGKDKGPGVPDGTGPMKDSDECPFNKDKEDKDDKDEDKKEDSDDGDGGLTEGQKKLPEALQNAIKNKAEVEKKFVKIANLDDKTKSWLRSYWENLYPKEFVDAMLSSK
jgi:hypothetical protein